MEVENKNIYKALADFQQECPVVHQGTKGYGYTYADLPNIFKVINPLLKKNNLGFTQLVQPECIETVLFHTTSGETITSQTLITEGVVLKGMNAFQILGSQITYLRRYALSSLLGIVTDKDIDASGEQTTKQVAKSPPKKADSEKPQLPPMTHEQYEKTLASKSVSVITKMVKGTNPTEIQKTRLRNRIKEIRDGKK